MTVFNGDFAEPLKKITSKRSNNTPARGRRGTATRRAGGALPREGAEPAGSPLSLSRRPTPGEAAGPPAPGQAGSQSPPAPSGRHRPAEPLAPVLSALRTDRTATPGHPREQSLLPPRGRLGSAVIPALCSAAARGPRPRLRRERSGAERSGAERPRRRAARREAGGPPAPRGGERGAGPARGAPWSCSAPRC